MSKIQITWYELIAKLIFHKFRNKLKICVLPQKIKESIRISKVDVWNRLQQLTLMQSPRALTKICGAPVMLVVLVPLKKSSDGRISKNMEPSWKGGRPNRARRSVLRNQRFDKDLQYKTTRTTKWRMLQSQEVQARSAGWLPVLDWLILNSGGRQSSTSESHQQIARAQSVDHPKLTKAVGVAARGDHHAVAEDKILQGSSRASSLVPLVIVSGLEAQESASEAI